MNLSQRVKYLRKLRKWTQHDLSQKSGVIRATIAKIENCTTLLPERRTTSRLAMAFGISEQYFLYGNDYSPEVTEILTSLEAMNTEYRKKVISVIRVLSV